MEALRVERLSKKFGGVLALCEASFSVGIGERLALIGPNGAGKTTLFNLVSGRFPVSSGRIHLFGKDVTSMPTNYRIHLGMARSFQLNSLFASLSVLENVLLALQGTCSSRYQMFRRATSYVELLVKAQELLEAINLWKRKNDLVQDLSYGDQRKLEIALSLASDPKLLLLDEPSAGLTSAESGDIVKIINKLKANISIIVIAHDMDLIFGLANRILVLHYGQIIADGKPEEIQNNSKVRQIYMGNKESA